MVSVKYVQSRTFPVSKADKGIEELERIVNVNTCALRNKTIIDISYQVTVIPNKDEESLLLYSAQIVHESY